MTDQIEAPAERHCLNCAAPAPLAFCPNCGQSTTHHAPTVREFAHEFVGHYVAIDGPLWITLKTLFLRPGVLTVEFLEGRRARYISPLRLFLSFSVILFLVLGLQTHEEGVEDAKKFGFVRVNSSDTPKSPLTVDFGNGVKVVAPSVPSDPAAASAASAAVNRSLLKMQDSLNQALPAALRKSDAHQPKTLEEEIAHISQNFSHYLPYMPFFLMPLLALIVMLVFFDRHRYYAEHLVYALHVHAVGFAFLTVGLLLPGGIIGYLVLSGLFIYGVISLRNVYGGRWPGLILRTFVISICYIVALFLASAFIIFLSIVT